MRNFLKTSLVATALIATPFAQAEFSLDKLSINVGAINVNPDSGSSALNEIPTAGLTVESNTQLGLTFDYQLDDNWVIELVAATPFSHDITGTGAIDNAKIGKTKHLPPSLFAQYHFGDSSAAFRPFIGAGVNYTTFFDEEAGADLKATLQTDDVEVKLDDSFGLAAQVGFNYMLDQQWGIHAMVSYIDIDTDAEVFANGAKALTSTVAIDPTVFMLGMKYKF